MISTPYFLNYCAINNKIPYKNKKSLLIKNFFKKKRKKSATLSNFFLYNLYNINCWYINKSLFLMPIFRTIGPLNLSDVVSNSNIRYTKTELLTQSYCSKYKTSQDFLFATLTVSNTYRNFFCNLSYKINGFKILSRKRKYFLKNNFNNFSYAHDKLNFIWKIKNNTNTSLKVIKNKEFLKLWFLNQSYLIFLFLFVCLLKSNTVKLKKLGGSPRQYGSVSTSGGLIAKTQTRGLVFLKKNSPSFLYKYFQNILNSLTKTITGETYVNNFSHVHLTILLKNFDKRYNFILKRLLKKFRKQVCGNNFYRKNIKLYKNFIILQTIAKKNIKYNKTPIKGALSLNFQDNTKNILYKTICLRLFTLQNIKKNYLKKKFQSICNRKINKSQRKIMQVVLNYQFFDLTSLPHNGTKTKIKPRK